MSLSQVFIKPNLCLEPLVSHWYAWAHLISPATAALQMQGSHLKIMQSYVRAPLTHVSALKNPAMAGGPFIDYGGKRVPEIRALLTSTKQEQGHLLGLADALKNLNDFLCEGAVGGSLEPLYENVPDILKGYVELIYDLNHRPSFRLIEGLLYRSPFYDENRQSLWLHLIENDKRQFAFSTPRLEDDSGLLVKAPFRHEAIDTLFRMRRQPGSVDQVSEMLGLDKQSRKRLESFTTEQPPKQGKAFSGEGVRVRYFGHACILVETKEVSFLTDPVICYPYPSDLKRQTFDDLPPTIDYVLITHSHPDHLLFETLLQLRHCIKTVVVPRCGGGALEDPSLKLLLKATGFNHVVEADEMDEIAVPGGRIVSLPFLGEHADLNIRTKNAFLLQVKGTSVVFAADSNNLENKLYTFLREAFGKPDMLFLGMECDGAPLSWIYGSLLMRPINRQMDQSRTLSGSDFSRAMAIVETLQPEEVIIYAMGQEPWLSFLTSLHYTAGSKQILESTKLLETCKEQGLSCERPYCTRDWLFN